MALLDDVKLSLRLSSTVYNTEITDLIATAKQDLLNCGILVLSETDPLIKRLIILYCKANFGYDNTDATRMQQAYEMLRNHVTLVGDYACYKVTINVKDSTSSGIYDAEVFLNNDAVGTSVSGVAVFYVRAGTYTYMVGADGYKDHLNADGDWIAVDITANTTINITMVDA